MSSISFKFSQTREKVQLSSLKGSHEEEEEEEEEKDYVKEVDLKKGLKSLKEKEEKKELIIPCPGDSLEAKAIEELLLKSKEGAEDGPFSSKESKDMIIYQASLEKAGVDTTNEDYESVPIEKFGMAMLKGMGWTPDSKKTVPTLEPALRPKGLGLGAALPKSSSTKTSSSSNNKGEDKLEMNVGAYVLVNMGTHKSKYGQVNGFDEETGRAFIVLALSHETVSISENALTLVTKKEYKEKGKVLNQDEYDKYSKKKKKRSRSRSPHNPLYMAKKEVPSNGKRAYSPSPPKKKAGPSWASPHLRVRYINEDYKQGRYYNTKMIVQDVTTPTTCILKSESDGRILDDVPLFDLETVIPKTSSHNQKVMIVRTVGSARKGTLATILSKDKTRCKAVVQSIYDKKDVWTLDFDDLCEYLGELMDEY